MKRFLSLLLALVLIVSSIGIVPIVRVSAEDIVNDEGEKVLTVGEGLDLTLVKVEGVDGLFRTIATVSTSEIPDGSVVLLSVEDSGVIDVSFSSNIIPKGGSVSVTFEYDGSSEMSLYEISQVVKLKGTVVDYYADAQNLVLSDWEYHIETKSNLDNGFVCNDAYLVLDEYIGTSTDVNVYAGYYFTEDMYNDMINRGFTISGVTIADYGKVLPCMMRGTDYDTYVNSYDDEEDDQPNDSNLDRGYGPFINNDTITSVTFYSSVYDNKVFGVSMSRLASYNVITADNIRGSYFEHTEDIEDRLDGPCESDGVVSSEYSIELDENGNNMCTYTQIFIL